MKKIFFLLSLLSSLYSQAQFSASNMSAAVSGNYMSFFKQKIKVAGAKVDLGYQFSEKVVGALSFTYSAPLKSASSYYYGGTNSYTIPTEAVTKISTISLGAQYFILANTEALSVYVPIGASLIIGSNSETATGKSTPAGYTLPDGYSEKEKFSSFMMYGGIGAMYPVGPIKLFADAAIAIPANQVNGAAVDVNIDSHLLFNVGVRIPFGTPDNDE
jgi:lipoprotein-anchoring transpeptidase ErfK/SrfK